jgi:hypothetical protein
MTISEPITKRSPPSHSRRVSARVMMAQGRQTAQWWRSRTTSFNGGADDDKRHTQQGPARVKVVAAALLALRFTQWAKQQQARQQIPQPTDVNVRPAVGAIISSRVDSSRP